MKLKSPLFLILFFSFIALNSTQGQKDSDEIIKKFFQLYESKPVDAVDYAFSTNKWMARNQDGLDNLKNQLKNTIDLVGDYKGYELITEKGVGENYKLISYMIKYDRQPIRFTFILYNPKNKWQVQNFKYDDSIDDELEESSKIYFLKDGWKY